MTRPTPHQSMAANLDKGGRGGGVILRALLFIANSVAVPRACICCTEDWKSRSHWKHSCFSALCEHRLSGNQGTAFSLPLSTTTNTRQAKDQHQHPRGQQNAQLCEARCTAKVNAETSKLWGGRKKFCQQLLPAFSTLVPEVQVWGLAGVQLNQSGKILSSHVRLRSFLLYGPASLFDLAGIEKAIVMLHNLHYKFGSHQCWMYNDWNTIAVRRSKGQRLHTAVLVLFVCRTGV